MIERVINGVLLEQADAQYLLDAFDALLQDRRPTPRLADYLARMRRMSAKLAPAQEDTPLDVRKLGAQRDSDHAALYDLVDANEAAEILGCGAPNVRDLGKRGVLPRHQVGRGWVYPAASVIALAEKRAKRG